MNDASYQSQVWQDKWVCGTLDNARDLRFLDVGAGDPVNISNTYVLESEFGWSGILCDVEHEDALRRLRSSRNEVYGDFFSIDLGRLKGQTFDYASLDIEPTSATMLAVAEMIRNGIRFRMATVEHNRYSQGTTYRDAMRGMLSCAGYEMVASDVMVVVDDAKLAPFEDWWVDPKLVNTQWARMCANQVLAISDSTQLEYVRGKA